jgi:hypothetical protein
VHLVLLTSALAYAHAVIRANHHVTVLTSIESIDVFVGNAVHDADAG